MNEFKKFQQANQLHRELADGKMVNSRELIDLFGWTLDMLESRLNGVLLLKEDAESDYILSSDAASVWITVGNLSVYVVRTDEGVSVDIYPEGQEADDALAGTWALYAEVNQEEDDND